MGLREVWCVRVVKTRNITCVFFCVVKIIFLFAVCFSLCKWNGLRGGDDERGRTSKIRESFSNV